MKLKRKIDSIVEEFFNTGKLDLNKDENLITPNGLQKLINESPPNTLGLHGDFYKITRDPDILSLNDKGAPVSILQALLDIEVTGTFDHITQEAVRKHQKNNDISPTGEMNKETWDTLVGYEKTLARHADIQKIVNAGVTDSDSNILTSQYSASEYKIHRKFNEKKYKKLLYKVIFENEEVKTLLKKAIERNEGTHQLKDWLNHYITNDIISPNQLSKLKIAKPKKVEEFLSPTHIHEQVEKIGKKELESKIQELKQNRDDTIASMRVELTQVTELRATTLEKYKEAPESSEEREKWKNELKEIGEKIKEKEQAISSESEKWDKEIEVYKKQWQELNMIVDQITPEIIMEAAKRGMSEEEKIELRKMIEAYYINEVNFSTEPKGIRKFSEKDIITLNVRLKNEEEPFYIKEGLKITDMKGPDQNLVKIGDKRSNIFSLDIPFNSDEITQLDSSYYDRAYNNIRLNIDRNREAGEEREISDTKYDIAWEVLNYIFTFIKKIKIPKKFKDEELKTMYGKLAIIFRGFGSKVEVDELLESLVVISKYFEDGLIKSKEQVEALLNTLIEGNPTTNNIIEEIIENYKAVIGAKAYELSFHNKIFSPCTDYVEYFIKPAGGDSSQILSSTSHNNIKLQGLMKDIVEGTKTKTEAYTILIEDIAIEKIFKWDIEAVRPIGDIITRGEKIEVKHVRWDKEGGFHLSEFFGMYKTTVDPPFNTPQYLQLYNNIIEMLYEYIGNDEIGERIIAWVRENTAGIFYKDYIYVPLDNIELEWSTRGQRDTEKRLSLRMEVTGQKYQWDPCTDILTPFPSTNENIDNYISEVLGF